MPDNDPNEQDIESAAREWARPYVEAIKRIGQIAERPTTVDRDIAKVFQLCGEIVPSKRWASLSMGVAGYQTEIRQWIDTVLTARPPDGKADLLYFGISGDQWNPGELVVHGYKGYSRTDQSWGNRVTYNPCKDQLPFGFPINVLHATADWGDPEQEFANHVLPLGVTGVIVAHEWQRILDASRIPVGSIRAVLVGWTSGDEVEVWPGYGQPLK